jgi:predicted nucleotidyltransferase
MTPNPELDALAEILARWVDEVPGATVYLFGSRVRGDHRPESDVDVRIPLNEWDPVTNETMSWWERQNKTNFADLQARLPGPLKVHREVDDAADAEIRRAAQNPVLVRRKVICLWTPPKGSLATDVPPVCSPEHRKSASDEAARGDGARDPCDVEQ